VFTIPPSADVGAELISNIQDPEAVNAQDVCPGYKASQLKESDSGISAVLMLAGAPCNVYGNDVDVLNLKVEYQSKDRLAVNISPAHLVSQAFAIQCISKLISPGCIQLVALHRARRSHSQTPGRGLT
jgi:alpha-glucosidase